MKVANATCLVLMWLLAATLYWNHSHSVFSHTLWDGYVQTTLKRTTNKFAWCFVNASILHTHINNNTFLIPPLQSPLIHKWKGNGLRSKKHISKTHNNNILYCCRMAYARSLEKSLDGAKDMEVTQTKKRSSSNACLTIVEKPKSRSSSQ